MALERMKSCVHVGALAQELGIDRGMLYRWRSESEAALEARSTPVGTELPLEDPRNTRLREENGQLKRALADKGLEVDFFKGALQKIAVRRQQRGNSGEMASTTRSGE